LAGHRAAPLVTYLGPLHLEAADSRSASCLRFQVDLPANLFEDEMVRVRLRSGHLKGMLPFNVIRYTVGT